MNDNRDWDEDSLNPEPLNGGERLVVTMLIVISALWGILLYKGIGWLVWWLKEVL
jgi:hypothetical protein